jgi:hypothetical protein
MADEQLQAYIEALDEWSLEEIMMALYEHYDNDEHFGEGIDKFVAMVDEKYPGRIDGSAPKKPSELMSYDIETPRDWLQPETAPPGTLGQAFDEAAAVTDAMFNRIFNDAAGPR